MVVGQLVISWVALHRRPPLNILDYKHKHYIHTHDFKFVELHWEAQVKLTLTQKVDVRLDPA
jgi:hypothetical protein